MRDHQIHSILPSSCHWDSPSPLSWCVLDGYTYSLIVSLIETLKGPHCSIQEDD
jgi:hypothetical protein